MYKKKARDSKGSLFWRGRGNPKELTRGNDPAGALQRNDRNPTMKASKGSPTSLTGGEQSITIFTHWHGTLTFHMTAGRQLDLTLRVQVSVTRGAETALLVGTALSKKDNNATELGPRGVQLKGAL